MYSLSRWNVRRHALFSKRSKPIFNQILTAVTSFVIGATATFVVGFLVLDWRSKAEAEDFALQFAKSEVTLALVPICVERARNDPELPKVLDQMKTLRNTSRTKLVMQAGWATQPHASSPNLDLANACMDEIISIYQRG
jgi:hypothetical protein